MKGQIKGSNKRCVWLINSRAFKDAHFAVYPERLCVTPINAGCPELVCNKCGKPREKIIKKEYKSLSKISLTDKARSSKQGNTFSNRKHGRAIISGIKEMGYTSCNCNVGFRKGIVLDPFFGAGTTGLVALKLNRNFIGIDLKHEYIDIANKRLKPWLEQRRLK